MKLTEVNCLKEEDVIADSVMTDDFQILLNKGAILKTEYIDKLKELGIKEVYIAEACDGIEKISEEMPVSEFQKKSIEIREACANQVKDILKRHIYHNEEKLSELKNAVNEILDDILEKPGVVKSVYEIQQRDPDLYEHTLSVCSMSMIIALKMDMEKDEIRELGTAAMLHDLGLRYITIHYEYVDLVNLSRDQQEEYKKHTVYGYSAVCEAGWLSEQEKKMILFHHENLAGRGYPLHMDHLSISTQILAVCEMIDEMICGIAYKKRKIWEVLSYLEEIKGIYFNKNIIEAVCGSIALYPIGTRLVLDDGSVGIVVKQNEKNPKDPILQIIEKGSRLQEAPDGAITLVNLEKDVDYQIVEVQEH